MGAVEAAGEGAGALETGVREGKGAAGASSGERGWAGTGWAAVTPVSAEGRLGGMQGAGTLAAALGEEAVMVWVGGVGAGGFGEMGAKEGTGEHWERDWAVEG